MKAFWCFPAAHSSCCKRWERAVGCPVATLADYRTHAVVGQESTGLPPSHRLRQAERRAPNAREWWAVGARQPQSSTPQPGACRPSSCKPGQACWHHWRLQQSATARHPPSQLSRPHTYWQPNELDLSWQGACVILCAGFFFFFWVPTKQAQRRTCRCRSSSACICWALMFGRLRSGAEAGLWVESMDCMKRNCQARLLVCATWAWGFLTC